MIFFVFICRIPRNLIGKINQLLQNSIERFYSLIIWRNQRKLILKMKKYESKVDNHSITELYLVPKQGLDIASFKSPHFWLFLESVPTFQSFCQVFIHFWSPFIRGSYGTGNRYLRFAWFLSLHKRTMLIPKVHWSLCFAWKALNKQPAWFGPFFLDSVQFFWAIPRLLQRSLLFLKHPMSTLTQRTRI